MNRLDHIVTDNLNNDKDQSNEATNSDPTFDTSSFNSSSGTSDPLPVVTVSLLGGKKHKATTVSGLTVLWYSGATDSMIKIRHINNYERKMRYNKVKYSIAAGIYCNTHDVKVPFFMLELSSSKIINHHFHIDNDKGESGICYDMIIGHDRMVQLVLTTNLKRQVLQWDGDTVHMKDPRNLLGQSDLTKRAIREVAMKTAEPDSTREATDLMVKILDSTYAKADLKQVANSTSQMNAE